MTLGAVLRKERRNKNLSPDEVAEHLGLSLDAYKKLEGGNSPVEEWGPKLAKIAIKLSTPTSRLISETGKSAQANPRDGQCGKLIRIHRKKREKTPQELAELLEIPSVELSSIENGDSPIETYGPILLGFAEIIDQPVFNLFYPCGVPFSQLNDYP